jgi:hypothetical protein
MHSASHFSPAGASSSELKRHGTPGVITRDTCFEIERWETIV